MQQKLYDLSLAERITLCKSVLQAILLYSMQSSFIPKALCYEIEKVCK
jgi:hypothetical protein